MDQEPKGISEEITDAANKEMKEAPPIGAEPVPEELKPVVDRSELAHPVKKRRA